MNGDILLEIFTQISDFGAVNGFARLCKKCSEIVRGNLPELTRRFVEIKTLEGVDKEDEGYFMIKYQQWPNEIKHGIYHYYFTEAGFGTKYYFDTYTIYNFGKEMCVARIDGYKNHRDHEYRCGKYKYNIVSHAGQPSLFTKTSEVGGVVRRCEYTIEGAVITEHASWRIGAKVLKERTQVVNGIYELVPVLAAINDIAIRADKLKK
nr:hypothetical protein K-LCC10_0304 [Kaumoebavirus]